MTRLTPALAATLALNLAPALAQEGEPQGAPGDVEEGMEMLSEGARTLLRGLIGRVEPEMQDLADALRNWNFQGLGPEDLGQYHPPEVLPNGDIIIRRKAPRDADQPMDDKVEI